jgi:hypothetical protein
VVLAWKRTRVGKENHDGNSLRVNDLPAFIEIDDPDGNPIELFEPAR